MLGRLSQILVVDGCAVSRKTTHQFLHALGHNIVDYAPDARTASRLIGQKNYTLVLADGDVTSNDGLDLLRETRADERLRYLPFLMAIALWKKKFIEIVREDGATLYLTKPFTVDILGQRMTQVYIDANRLKDARVKADPSLQIGSKPDGAGVPALWRHLRPLA